LKALDQCIGNTILSTASMRSARKVWSILVNTWKFTMLN